MNCSGARTAKISGEQQVETYVGLLEQHAQACPQPPAASAP